MRKTRMVIFLFAAITAMNREQLELNRRRSLQLGDSLSNIESAADLHELARFDEINATVFWKISRRHDLAIL